MPANVELPMTCDEVSSLLGISRRTLMRWRRLRKGPPGIKVGRVVYYRRAAFERWLLSLEDVADNAATVARRFR